jgi:hypothetical protein
VDSKGCMGVMIGSLEMQELSFVFHRPIGKAIMVSLFLQDAIMPSTRYMNLHLNIVCTV